jgi:hypothetical protein
VLLSNKSSWPAPKYKLTANHRVHLGQNDEAYTWVYQSPAFIGSLVTCCATNMEQEYMCGRIICGVTSNTHDVKGRKRGLQFQPKALEVYTPDCTASFFLQCNSVRPRWSRGQRDLLGKK